MNSPSFASLLLLSSTLVLGACPGGSDDTESGTTSAASTSDASTGTASASSTDGTTGGSPTGTDDTGAPTSGSTSTTDPATTTSTVTTEPGTVTNVTDASTTDASTTDASTTEPGTETGVAETGSSEDTGTTGEPGQLVESCGDACDVVLMCAPERYESKEACVTECSTAASPDPACQAAAAAFNDCVAGYSCADYVKASEGDFGGCADDFNTYLASCQ